MVGAPTRPTEYDHGRMRSWPARQPPPASELAAGCERSVCDPGIRKESLHRRLNGQTRFAGGAERDVHRVAQSLRRRGSARLFPCHRPDEPHRRWILVRALQGPRATDVYVTGAIGSEYGVGPPHCPVARGHLSCDLDRGCWGQPAEPDAERHVLQSGRRRYRHLRQHRGRCPRRYHCRAHTNQKATTTDLRCWAAGHRLPARSRLLGRAAHGQRVVAPRWLPSRLIPHRHCPRAELQPAYELQVETLR